MLQKFSLDKKVLFPFLRPLIIGCVIAFSIVISVASQEFDGNGVWIHHMRQSPQGDILSIYSLPDGRLWADTERSFHIFDGTKWELVPFNPDILGEDPPFITDGEGVFYFIHDEKLIVYDSSDESSVSYDSEALIFPAYGAFSSTGDLFIASYDAFYGGLYKFSDGTVTKLRDGVTRSVAVDNSDNIWISHNDNPNEDSMKLLVWDNDQWTDKTDDISQIFNPALHDKLTVFSSPDENIWVNNEGDLGIFSNNSWVFHDGGSNVAPRYIHFDPAGRIWGYGLRKLYLLQDDFTWNISRLITDGILSFPWFMATPDDGTAWITDKGNLYQYTPEADSLWTEQETSHDLASDIVTSIAYTSRNQLVCGHGIRGTLNNFGVSILDGRDWVNYKRFENTSLSNIYDMVQTPSNDILMYSGTGLHVFDGKTWSRDDSLLVFDERDMFVDDSGILWMGSFDGLIRYDFDVRPDTLQAPADATHPFRRYGYDRFFQDSQGYLYMQNEYERFIIRYDETELNDKWTGLVKNSQITDFVVGDDELIRATNGDWLMTYRGENMWEKVKDTATDEIVTFEDASFCNYDEDGRLWVSGNNNTGYFDNDGAWHRITELNAGGASEWAWSYDGRLAFNAFRVLDSGEKEYYGVFEYRPYDVIADVEEAPNAPFEIKQNFPNPFNASTLIPFELSATDIVRISVYNTSGQKVRTLTNQRYPAGNHAVFWNADNDSGERVASGLYFYQIHTSLGKGTGKMLYLR